MLRTPHRWLGLIAALFLLNAGITGVILETSLLLEGGHREKKSDLPDYTLSSSSDQLQSDLSKAQVLVLAQVRQDLGDPTADPGVSKISLDARSGEVTFYLKRKDHSRYAVDLTTGTVHPLAEDNFILRLHSGELFGEVGHGFGVFWGLALIFLSLSGLFMYLQMWLARKKKLGRTRLFW